MPRLLNRFRNKNKHHRIVNGDVETLIARDSRDYVIPANAFFIILYLCSKFKFTWYQESIYTYRLNAKYKMASRFTR